MTHPVVRATKPDAFSREVLEFPAVLELLRTFLSGPITEPLLASLGPRGDLESIRRDHERVREAREFLGASARPGLGSLRDPRSILAKLRVEGLSLTGREIVAVLALARTASDLRTLFAKTPFAHLDELARGLPDFRSLISELDGKILPDGSLDSSASAELARLRRAIERMRHDLQAMLEKILRRHAAHDRDSVLQDAVVTIRNERFVIPVRAEERRRLPGVVHGSSSSGATVFVEPLETVPLNNELVELQEREYAEVQRLLGEFSGKLRVRQEELAAAAEVLGELDLAFAKAEFAREYDCTIPELTTDRALFLRDVRHPLLEKTLRPQHRKSVPLTVELGEPKTLMVISGPNAGGKTVALKTVGLAALMAQAGLPVVAGEARLPLFGRVLADIGDQQSIEANLSTFSAHVTNIQSMVERVGRDDLVLLDELGASTDPGEGAALGVAILDHFRALGAMTFVTTHHGRLKAYATGARGAVNAAMEFDEPTLRPTFRLLVGLPGKSSALEIAERLGLESLIVDRARALLDPSAAEAATLIARLHDLRAELERGRTFLEDKQKEIEARKLELERRFEQERRAKLRELDARLEETLRQYEKKWEEMREELCARTESTKAAQKAERKARAVGREAREEWNAQVLETLGAPPAEETVVAGPPAVGDRVRVGDLSTPGTVTAFVGDDEVEVEVGRLRLRTRRDELRVLPRKKAVEPGPGGVADVSAEAPEEIKVIGNTAEEACERVDKFLDQAYMARRFRLRVIHGHGKGVLKKKLHEMFASHPHVEKFYPAPQHGGGSGVTIVELKR